MKARMTALLLFFVLLLSPWISAAQESEQARNQRMEWWRDATFGNVYPLGALCPPGRGMGWKNR